MNLIDMKPFMLDIVNSFSAVSDLELTIINANPMVRVAGTGKYNNDYKKKNWEGTYTLKVIKEKEATIALDTQDPMMKITGDFDRRYYSLILQPIVLDDEVEGVICMASFTEEQQKIIKAKCNDFLYYLENVASLISSKLKQAILLEKLAVVNQRLSTIFESVTDGILLYSAREEEILHMNTRASSMLMFENIEESNEIMQVFRELGHRALREEQEIKKEIHGVLDSKTYSLIVKARPIFADKTVLFIINRFDEIQKIITQNLDEPFSTDNIVSNNMKMLDLKKNIQKVAKYSSNILILGESGTGKELVARAIHSKRNRKNSPFVAINCAAIPQSLMESELFGYEGGAFTGAKKGGKIGKFMLANNGTLFLDEIGDMPLHLQTKLLRVLEDHMIEPIGSTDPIKIDVHIIAATNKNLEEMVKNREFREDLYYRLNVISFYIPPLRERKDDILLLVDHFINKYNKKFSKNIQGIDDWVREILLNYSWPGNVRELENCVEYMMNFAEGTLISIKDVPKKLLQMDSTPSNIYNLQKEINTPILDNNLPLDGTLKEISQHVEREIIKSFVLEYGDPTVEDIKEICKRLDISMTTYYRKLKS